MDSPEQSIDQKIEELYLEATAEITKENMTMDSETGAFHFEDDAALKLVLDDLNYAETYVSVNQWASSWSVIDTLLQSPATASAFDGGNVARANVPKYTLSNTLNSTIPKITESLFYEDPPFLLRPRPATSQKVVEAKTALFAYQLGQMGFAEECELFLQQEGLLGTGIAKWGYKEYIKKVAKFKRKAPPATLSLPTGPKKIHTTESDEFETYYEDKLISHPWFKWVDLRTVFVNPGCRVGDIRKCGHLVERNYATFDDLNQLRDIDGYDIPEENVLKELFLRNQDTGRGADNISMTIPEGMRGYLQHAVPRSYKTTSDPTEFALELFERWDDNKVIVVLSCNGHNILIRNDVNPYGKIPYYSANWRNLPDSFYGQGLGLLVGSEQLVQQGVNNLCLDMLAYRVQPTAIRKKGFNATTQAERWKLGGIINVDDDVDKSFKFLEMPQVPPEALAWIAKSQSDAAGAAGSNELVGQGASLAGAHSTGMRSGTGSAAVVQANASRLDDPTSRFVRQVFEPWLYQMDELNNMFLPSSVLRDVLGEELGKEFDVDHEEFRNARIEYEVLAGAHLGPKKEMAQAIPFVLQLLNNPTFAANLADAGYRFDGLAIFKGLTDLSGWKYSQPFVVPMSPEQKQQHDANSPAALQQKQAQAQQQAQLQKFQQEQQLQSEMQLGKAGSEVARQVVEKALTPEEVQGEPGGEGFGSSVAL